MNTNCNLCGSDDTKQIIEIGKIPLGYPVKSISEIIWQKSLTLIFCQNCFVVFTRYCVPAGRLVDENLYQSTGYRLISNHDYFFASWATEHTSIQKKDLIIEIGCSDGSLLERFLENGYSNLIGIEPSLHISKNYRFDVIESFFNLETVNELIKRDKRPKVIIANYVLELIPDLNEFVKNLSLLMNKGSYVIIEVPYFNDFFFKRRIDGFAHLRTYWFTKNSLVSLFSKFNFRVVNIEHDSLYRGGTLRALFMRDNKEIPITQEIIKELIVEKNELELENILSNAENINVLKKIIVSSLMNFFYKKTVIIYGAGHKATTLIFWLGLTDTDIHYAVDNDLNKQGRYIPNSKIPIKSVKDMLVESENKSIIVLNFAIDHTEEVVSFLKTKLCHGSKIINLLPNFSVLDV